MKTEVLRECNDMVISEYVFYCSALLMVAEYDSLSLIQCGGMHVTVASTIYI